ncbi:hypothetical protein KIM372_13540 [Bombiscardovia nodaiensis]|uniref:Uncharacterized protein n=1 Tax=Bombiscardovia nodaiensis TaxID=2932181 RepID=A0ABM8B983_9BIFI|nr:hypothetical protein KIM372_13540 [Bombiscardovia nodaiensis]
MYVMIWRSDIQKNITSPGFSFVTFPKYDTGAFSAFITDLSRVSGAPKYAAASQLILQALGTIFLHCLLMAQ